MSALELALDAVKTALASIEGLDIHRNRDLPVKIAAGGFASLHDGESGEPEALLSPARWIYSHTADLVIAVERASPAARDAAFDALRAAIGAALVADRTLSGTVDWVEVQPGVIDTETPDGGNGIKAGSIPILLEFTADNPF
ncbi:hypothetical protein [Oceanibacterium hippocampi]|uniref:Uncharacterized protein n=1 Tax=Oceanibacterium hippocampi TaxID=745714 RepID=A0A1Y5TZP6_9PROT|nr:hypothetical protein [Oceanibacterium hippocampi]SLN77307.1 hypothetical protein OCH7691_04380 [Oceanibacterium hippocampi]